MDGNGRWAIKRSLSRLEGHQAGFATAREAIIYLSELGVPCITIFSFSTENWKRPKDEITGLLKLLEIGLNELSKEFYDHNIIIRHLGQQDKLPLFLRKGINNMIEKTQSNTGTIVNVAFDYGSRTEIINATKQMIQDHISVKAIDEVSFESYLSTKDLPDVDLIIRTGGEQRLSNFLLWQAAFAELYFTDTLWPDFGRIEIDKALAEYSSRTIGKR
ncbi:undecaprenyl diphosphate synthase [Dehalogenimonas sp. WBC-2]|nr:undecaprenyl diphosphate synthase [Dehalogenimonas sp. WBC-2]